MYCCAGCFGDSFLNKRIPEMSKRRGTCDFCLAINNPLVEPQELRDHFQSVCSIYAEDTGVGAKSLTTLFQEDWQIFTYLDPVKAQALLGEVLDDGQVVRKNYVPRNVATVAAVEKWASFRNDIMWGNRFFFQQELDLQRLEALFENYLAADATIFSNQLFRARIQTDGVEIPLEEMGKPPAKYVKNGRANPVGIPYLYAASTPETAIAETRPHPGDLVSVAKFGVKGTLRLLNLQHPRETVSPFSDPTDQAALRDDLAFLCHLENELSKPILPRVADLEYLPTQYLCEFIKRCGYDGVVFKSSISSGANVALFDDSKVNAEAVIQYEVTKLHYDQTPRPV